MRSGSLSVIKCRVRWGLSRVWASLGALELLAIALLALWLGLHLQVSKPLQTEVTLLDSRAQALLATMRDNAQPVSVNKNSPDTGRDFIGFFPLNTQREPQLARLHQLLDEHGLQLVRVDYGTEPVAALPLQRVTLKLSIQGGYVMQRKFLHKLLVMLPNLALERITLEKTSDSMDGMSTLLNASLYYRPATPQSTRS